MSHFSLAGLAALVVLATASAAGTSRTLTLADHSPVTHTGDPGSLGLERDPAVEFYRLKDDSFNDLRTTAALVNNAPSGTAVASCRDSTIVHYTSAVLGPADSFYSTQANSGSQEWPFGACSFDLNAMQCSASMAFRYDPNVCTTACGAAVSCNVRSYVHYIVTPPSMPCGTPYTTVRVKLSVPWSTSSQSSDVNAQPGATVGCAVIQFNRVIVGWSSPSATSAGTLGGEAVVAVGQPFSVNISASSGGSLSTNAYVGTQSASAQCRMYINGYRLPPGYRLARCNVIPLPVPTLDTQGLVDIAPIAVGQVFSQTGGAWGALPYDHDPKGRSIGLLGCALTCLAMALNERGAAVDPRILNQIMNDSSNVPGEGDWKGTSVMWDNAVRDASVGNLKWNPLPPTRAAFLEALSQHHPVILGVNPDADLVTGHFVLAIGVQNGKIVIMDPRGGVQRVLEYYCNAFRPVGYVSDANVFAGGPAKRVASGQGISVATVGADLLVRDAMGRRCGFDAVGRVEVNELPDCYIYRDAIGDTLGSVGDTTSVLHMAAPVDGVYEVIVRGLRTGPYIVTVRGDVASQSLAGSISLGATDTLRFSVVGGAVGVQGDDHGQGYSRWLSIPSPNPGHGYTSVVVGGPSGVLRDVGVYGIDGRRIRVLENAHIAAGARRLVWDGRDDRGALAPPGTYFVTARFGTMRVTHTIILLR